MIHEHVVQRQVAFSETDAGGIVHFTNLQRYAEDAEHALLRTAGLSVVTIEGDQTFGWPRVAIACQFFSPLKFEDHFETHVMVQKIGRSSITYVFEIRKLDPSQDRPTVVAQGKTTAVCVEGIGSGKIRAAAIPESVTAKLEPAPEDKLFISPTS